MKKFVLYLLLLFCFNLFSKDYTINDFNDEMRTRSSRQELNAICSDFIENASDMNVVRGVARHWLQANEEKCREFLAKKLEENPNSKKYLYLNARNEEDIDKQMKISRKLIKMDENWIDGYKLMASIYMGSLFYRQAEPDVIEELKKSIKKDKKHLRKFEKIGTDDPFAHQFNFRYLIYLGKFSKAEKYLESLDRKTNGWISNMTLAEFEVLKGKYDEAKKFLKDEADSRISNEKLSEKNRNYFYVYYLHAFFYDNQLYKEYINFVLKDKDIPMTPETYYYLARCYVKIDKADKAAENLLLAAANGFDDSHYVKDNPDFDLLKDHAEWDNIIKAIDEQKQANELVLKKEVQADKLNKPAPQFQLKNAAGEMIRLADLKGEYVLLDFWATWCGPCKMTMPLLDEWNKEHNKNNVRVFSVNVWERFPENVETLMKSNNYSMELLYGNKELAEAYEVQGIPYICLIDKNGNIVYEEKGYDRELVKTINWWMEALTSEE